MNPYQNINVLVVDNYDKIRSVVKGILEEEGYQVDTAADTVTALETIGKSDTPYHIILCEFEEESYYKLKPWFRNISDFYTKKDQVQPVYIFMSRTPRRYLDDEFKKCAFDILEKSFKLGELLCSVEKAAQVYQEKPQYIH